MHEDESYVINASICKVNDTGITNKIQFCMSKVANKKTKSICEQAQINPPYVCKIWNPFYHYSHVLSMHTVVEQL